MSIKILKPGLLTTIQDMGRTGYQKEGVIVSGAMDRYSLCAANYLVGNSASEAALEVTLTGLLLQFDKDHIISITGAEMSPHINGAAVKMWRPIYIRAGATLELKFASSGCRCYIAVAGGIEVPKVMNSYATYLMANLGGYNGRALRADDVLTCHDPNDLIKPLKEKLKGLAIGHQFSQVTWSMDPQQHSLHEEEVIIRVLRGLEYDLFSDNSKDYFWNDKYQVNHNSNRMGYNLLGTPLHLTENKEMISSAVTYGTVQVPPQGHPIILMADHQTTGGYPRIAQVISSDLPKLAQVQPGKTIRFEEVTLKEAHELYLQQELSMKQLKSALSLKYHSI